MRWSVAAVILGAGLGAMACGDEPAGLTPEACQDRGGQVFADQGDGSSYTEGCPPGKWLLGTVDFGVEGGICCSQ